MFFYFLITKYTTGSAATSKTGPNDARHVVWACGEFFFFFLRIFLMLTNVLLTTKYATGSAATTETVQTTTDTSFGPVVSFFFPLLFNTKLLIINIFLVSNNEIRYRKCSHNGNDINGPKRMSDTSFGPVVSFFSFFFAFF